MNYYNCAQVCRINSNPSKLPPENVINRKPEQVQAKTYEVNSAIMNFDSSSAGILGDAAADMPTDLILQDGRQHAAVTTPEAVVLELNPCYATLNPLTRELCELLQANNCTQEELGMHHNALLAMIEEQKRKANSLRSNNKRQRTQGPS